MRILLVEDEARLRSLIGRGLTEAGHVADLAASAAEARALIKAGTFDVVILDVLLGEGENGFAFCKWMREQAYGTPVLMLTALEEIDDRVRGLRSGADDYLVKPFAFRELLARLEALSRRHLAERRSRITYGPLSFDMGAREAAVNGVTLQLSGKEISILEQLMMHPRHVFSRIRLEDCVWGFDPPSSNLVEVYIARIRRRIADAGCPDPIVTARGVGYKFDPELLCAADCEALAPA